MARFNSVYKEYKKAPAITKKRIYLDTMKTVMGEKNITVIDDKVKGVLPVYGNPLKESK